jgi:hypothetical protein
MQNGTDLKTSNKAFLFINHQALNSSFAYIGLKFTIFTFVLTPFSLLYLLIELFSNIEQGFEEKNRKIEKT